VNLVTLADELAAAADTIAGLRVAATPGEAIRAPALVVGLPRSVEFDQTYGRGSDVVRVVLYLMVGRTSERAGGRAMLGYLSGSGATSIKAAIEGATYTAADVVHVESADAGAISADGVEYLGATFETMIIGRGTG
jgi:hypothetical protein